jgi:rubrerythrin
MAQVTERIRDLISGRATVKHEVLMDMLSEFLTVEKGGCQLYQHALARTSDPDVVNQYEIFLKQTMKHAELLTQAIQQLGGDPAYMSAGAQLAQTKAECLLKTMVSDGLNPLMAELNMLENLVLAETKDQADWELLGKLSRLSTDEHVRDVLKPIVETVEPEEDDHLEWNKRKMAELAFRAVTK